MKMKVLAVSTGAALLLGAAGCQSQEPMPSSPPDPPAVSAVLTDAPSSDATDNALSTSATQPESSETADSSGTEKPAEKETEKPAGPSMADTSGTQPTKLTKTPAAPPVSTSFTSSRTTTARRTETTAPPTTTTSPPKEKSPWRYPYDVPAILEECKAEIARVGLVWEEALVGLPGRAGIPIGLPNGMSKDDPSIIWAGWDNPDSTVPFTKHPDGIISGNTMLFDGSLKNALFNDIIPFYVEQQERYSMTCCKIWFEPDPNTQGDYLIYFLFA